MVFAQKFSISRVGKKQKIFKTPLGVKQNPWLTLGQDELLDPLRLKF